MQSGLVCFARSVSICKNKALAPLKSINKGIISLCKENGFVLLTNDKDFASADLEILTSNPALLK